VSIISQSKKKILFQLLNEPKHGYKIAKSTNLPMGSIYDHLSELLKAGFIECEEKDGKKIYKLTKKGEILLKALE